MILRFFLVRGPTRRVKTLYFVSPFHSPSNISTSRWSIGKLQSKTGKFQQQSLPAGKDFHPYAIAVDDRDYLWTVETGDTSNRLIGFNPSTEKFFSITEIPSGTTSVRHMYFHKPSGELWFGEDSN